MANTVSEFTEVFEPELSEAGKSMIVGWTNEVIDTVMYQIGIDLPELTIKQFVELKEIVDKLKKQILA